MRCFCISRFWTIKISARKGSSINISVIYVYIMWRTLLIFVSTYRTARQSSAIWSNRVHRLHPWANRRPVSGVCTWSFHVEHTFTSLAMRWIFTIFNERDLNIYRETESTCEVNGNVCRGRTSFDTLRITRYVRRYMWSRIKYRTFSAILDAKEETIFFGR